MHYYDRTNIAPPDSAADVVNQLSLLTGTLFQPRLQTAFAALLENNSDYGIRYGHIRDIATVAETLMDVATQLKQLSKTLNRDSFSQLPPGTDALDLINPEPLIDYIQDKVISNPDEFTFELTDEDSPEAVLNNLRYEEAMRLAGLPE